MKKALDPASAPASRGNVSIQPFTTNRWLVNAQETPNDRKFSFHKKYSHTKHFGDSVGIITSLRKPRKAPASTQFSGLFLVPLSSLHKFFSFFYAGLFFFPFLFKQLLPPSLHIETNQGIQMNRGIYSTGQVTNLPSSVSDILNRSLVSGNI